MSYKDLEKNRAYHKEWNKNHPEKARARSKQWAENNRERSRAKAKQWAIDNPEKAMLQSATKHAKEKGFEFSIGIKDILIPDACPIFGFPLSRSLSGHQSDNSPSLDRIDSEQGYVPGNVWVISWKANSIKKNSSVVEFEKLVSSLREKPWLGKFISNDTPENLAQARQMLKSARRRARKMGWEFDLKLSDIVIPKECPIFGLSLQKGIKVRHAQSPSLDRIDSSKGYIKGNIWVISWRSNELKSNATLEELETLLATWKKRINIPIA